MECVKIDQPLVKHRFLKRILQLLVRLAVRPVDIFLPRRDLVNAFRTEELANGTQASEIVVVHIVISKLVRAWEFAKTDLLAPLLEFNEILLRTRSQAIRLAVPLVNKALDSLLLCREILRDSVFKMDRVVNGTPAWETVVVPTVTSKQDSLLEFVRHGLLLLFRGIQALSLNTIPIQPIQISNLLKTSLVIRVNRIMDLLDRVVAFKMGRRAPTAVAWATVAAVGASS